MTLSGHIIVNGGGNGYETRQSSLLNVFFVVCFGLDRAQNTCTKVVYLLLTKEPIKMF